MHSREFGHATGEAVIVRALPVDPPAVAAQRELAVMPAGERQEPVDNGLLLDGHDDAIALDAPQERLQAARQVEARDRLAGLLHGDGRAHVMSVRDGPMAKQAAIAREDDSVLAKRQGDDLDAVSYTHLTLPTIYSV